MYNIDTIFIHIGKCAGSTIRRELGIRGFRFLEMHLSKVEFHKKIKYIIAIRNPISRYISAFNWRYKLVVEKGIQANRFSGEKKILEKYKTANNLAENLYNTNDDLIIDLSNNEFYIHHIKEDINYYIGDFLEECHKENLLAILVTETLDDDLKKCFNIKATSQVKKNKKDTQLSELAINNLIKYLQKDYDCIEKMNDMGLLSTEQYRLLSSKTDFS